MSKIIGIDLGTTFSAVSHINDNQTPELIPNETGDRLTPSVVLYDEGEFFVGEYAKQNAVALPEQTVEFVKREMGQSKEASTENLMARSIQPKKSPQRFSKPSNGMPKQNSVQRLPMRLLRSPPTLTTRNARRLSRRGNRRA